MAAFELRKDTPEDSGIWTGVAVCDGVGSGDYWQGQVFLTANGYSSFWVTYVEYGNSVPSSGWSRYDFGGSGGGLTLVQKYDTPKMVGDYLEIAGSVSPGDVLMFFLHIDPGGYSVALEGFIVVWCFAPAKSGSSSTPLITIPAYEDGIASESVMDTVSLRWNATDYMLYTANSNCEPSVWRIYKM